MEDIEAYLMTRLNTGKRVHTKLGLQLRGRLKPATVHQEFRVLRRILSVAVKKRRLAVNPCGSVEFPVALAGTTRKPHYLTASEQERLEACAPLFLILAQHHRDHGGDGAAESVWKLGLAGWKSKGIMIRSRILVFRSSPSRRSGSLPN